MAYGSFFGGAGSFGRSSLPPVIGPSYVRSITPRNTQTSVFGSASGSSSGGLPAELLKQLTKSQKQANEANEARYQEILGGRQKLFDEATAGLENYGTGQRNRINQEYIDLGNSSLARLASRGLGSSSLTSATQLGVERQKQDALANFEDQLFGRKADIQRSFGNDLYGFQERRDDVGPDINKILPLLFQSGASGATGGADILKLIQSLLGQ